ncbi:MAG TPA: hypothetical protein VK722_02290 [Candidatus Aquilonibacter sp.]|jgi:hypothetical protein|nr:hypothetical protein [Candidatus Aquilonibacter sp.]
MNKETRTRILKRIKVDEFPEQWLEAIRDQERGGLKRINPDNEDSPFHCSAEWHFARFTGDGASLAPLVYGIAFHIAGDSGNFAASVVRIAKYLNAKEDYVYSAVNLLVLTGFFQVIEAEKGKPTQYRVVGHKQWAETHPGYCTKKIEKLFPDEDPLGKKLFGILGGEEYFPNLLKGLRNTGATDEQIEQAGKLFMEHDKGNGSRGRRKRFQDQLRAQYTKDHTP